MPLARWIEPQTLQARRESSPVWRKFASLRAASPLSQPSQSLFHTRHKGVPLRFAGDIEVVEGEVFDARLARSEPAQIARDNLPRRVAHPFGHVPGAAIGDDSDDLADVLQRRLDVGRIGNIEGDARHQQTVAESLQHRGHAEAPYGLRRLGDGAGPGVVLWRSR